MKKRLANNIGLKILSLLIAIVLWMVVIDLDNPTITKNFTIPVTVKNESVIKSLDQVYEIVQGDTITFTAEAKRSVITNLRSTDFKAEADLEHLSDVNAVRIYVDCIKTTETPVKIIYIKGDTLRVSLEDLAVNQYKVTIIPTGAVADGYSIGDAKAKPNIIQVSGAKSQVEKIDQIRVNVDVSNASEDFKVTAEPKVYDVNGQQIDSNKFTFSTNEVNVDIHLLKTKTVPITIIPVGEPADGYKFSYTDYEPKKVTIAGTAEQLQSISILPVEIDITNASENIEEEIGLTAFLPENIRLSEEEQSIMVSLTIEPLITKEFFILPNDIQIKNVPDNLEYIINTISSLYIKVRGLANDMNQFHILDLKPYVDAKDLKAGKYKLKVQFEKNDNIQILSDNLELFVTLEKREITEEQKEQEEEKEESNSENGLILDELLPNNGINPNIGTFKPSTTPKPSNSIKPSDTPRPSMSPKPSETPDIETPENTQQPEEDEDMPEDNIQEDNTQEDDIQDDDTGEDDTEEDNIEVEDSKESGLEMSVGMIANNDKTMEILEGINYS